MFQEKLFKNDLGFLKKLYFYDHHSIYWEAISIQFTNHAQLEQVIWMYAAHELPTAYKKWRVQGMINILAICSVSFIPSFTTVGLQFKICPNLRHPEDNRSNPLTGLEKISFLFLLHILPILSLYEVRDLPWWYQKLPSLRGHNI